MPGTASAQETVEAEIHVVEEDKRTQQNQETRNGQKSQFHFDDWAISHGIQRKTTKVLRDQDICTVDTLILISTEELLSIGITLGQAKTVVSAAAALKISDKNKITQDSNQGTSQENGTTATDLTAALNTPVTSMDNSAGISLTGIRRQTAELSNAGRQFDQLFTDSNIHSYEQPVNHTVTNVNSFQDNIKSYATNELCASDPRSVLTVKAVDRKAVHITQFLSEKAKRRQQYRRKDLVLTRGNSGENQLMVQADERHPYAGLSIDEWAAANIRLLHHLTNHGLLSRNDMDFYLAYTVTIFEFVNKYEWASILDFDYQYREQQAQLGFQWGQINPLMEMQLLVPRQNNSFNQRRDFKATRSFRTEQTSNEECHQWKLNHGYCPFGRTCKYKHIPLNQINVSNGDQHIQSKNSGGSYKRPPNLS